MSKLWKNNPSWNNNISWFIPPIYDMETLYAVWKWNYKPWWIPVIYGPTATGKTSLSLYIARKLADQGEIVEIISADSRQLYRGMDIGTDKVDITIRDQIIHHLIDIIDPNEIYTAGQWQQAVYQLIPEIQGRGHIPMIVGGTWLYIDTIVFDLTMGLWGPDRVFRNKIENDYKNALINDDPLFLWKMLDSVDPQEASKHHPSSTRFIIRALEIYHQTGTPKSQLVKKNNPRYPLQLVSLQQDIQIGNKLIDIRLEQMLERGLISEVQWLLDAWYDPNWNALKTIDYRQTVDYLTSHWAISFDYYRTSLQVANHQLAKKQRTWFRRYENYLFKEESLVSFCRYNLIDYII